jgi:hypothetical protein
MFNLTTWHDMETLDLLGRKVVPALQDPQGRSAA